MNENVRKKDKKPENLNDIIIKHLESLPYPEELFKDYPIDLQWLIRKNWSGNPDKFLANCERELGIKIGEYDEKTGTVPVTKTEKK